jgi:spermidine/putrescine-binding protein
MSMTRYAQWFLAGLLGSAAFGAQAEPAKVNIYNWYDFIAPDTLKNFQAREGAPVWVESLVLLNDAPNPQQGLAFIDYMLRPDVIAQSSNYLSYANANKDAKRLVDAKVRDNPGVYPTKVVLDTLFPLFPLEPLPLKLERVRTRIWSKVKSGT